MYQQQILTLAELKAIHNQEMAKPWNVSPADHYTAVEDGWFSTSKNTPEKGHIFKRLPEPVVITFVDKYRKTHICILDSVSWDTTLRGKELGVSGLSNHTLSDGSPIRVGLLYKKFKVLEGTLPPANSFSKPSILG